MKRAEASVRFFFGLFLCFFFAVSCVSQSRSEEYYALGTAYFNLGKYAEAETWFNRAKFNGKTRMASLYHLGRIAFDQGRYAEAIDCFKIVLAGDPANVTALRAISYSYAKNGKADEALEGYSRVAELVPDSAEEQYNYALLLAAVGRNAEAEEVLKKLSASAAVDDTALLLLARAQKEQKKPEALDSYKNYLVKKEESAVRFEYAGAFEDQKLYAKSLEEYSALYERASDSAFPSKSLLAFRMARVLLAADPADAKGMEKLEEALRGGYNNEKEIDALLGKAAVPAKKRTELKQLMKKR